MNHKPPFIEAIEQLTQLINEKLADNDRPVSRYLPAETLSTLLDLKLDEKGSSTSTLYKSCAEYLSYSPDVSQTMFFKQLYSGVDSAALLGDWVASISNANMHTYQMSPVATLMELELIAKWNQLLGFSDKYGNGGEGIMVNGGSQANLIAMMLARHRIAPNCKQKGLQGKTLVAYVSDQAHYSNQRAANLLGIGTDNLISVASDNKGRLIPAELERQIKISIHNGDTPFYVCLTAGTTVLGAFDPISECQKIAKDNACWLHVDGAWGAPVLFSKKHSHLMAGVKDADSASWDAHKVFAAPLTASGIQVREAGQLKDAIAGGGGEYLFHHDENSAFNLGEKSIQCGRRADALKAWLSWKSTGSSGYRDKIEHLQTIKQYCVAKLKADKNLELLAPAVYINILFRYKPCLNTLSDEALDTLNIRLCDHLKKEGTLFVDYATHQGKTGIRLIIANSAISTDDIDTLIYHCKKAGGLFS